MLVNMAELFKDVLHNRPNIYFFPLKIDKSKTVYKMNAVYWV